MQPTQTTQKIKLPKYTLLEKSNTGGHCDRCDRSLKNVYVIRNNESKEVGHYGSGCAKKVMGISITDMVQENINYENQNKRIESEENFEKSSRANIQSFTEAEPEMIDFIENNTENNIIKDMKKRIEESGSLTEGQYNAVKIMMIPFDEIDKDTKVDMIVRPIKLTIDQNHYGWEYNIIAVTDNNTKVKIYFSSLNAEKESILEDSKIIDIDSYGHRYGRVNLNNDVKIHLVGTFDGYKIKRAKIHTI